MKYFNLKKNIVYLTIIIVIFFLDRFSKIYIINIYEKFGIVDISLGDFLNIILIWNSGIGFGLLSFQDSIIYNFITFLIIIINLLILFFIYNYNDSRSYLLCLILGGSLGNLYDRIIYSAVPDFIDLNYNNFHWFVFNVADIFITIGVICLIFVEFFIHKNEGKDALKNEN
tara:strand:- start:81 stop:593 length:513 start_codon:yes stop_codon:yes gene_type:complete